LFEAVAEQTIARDPTTQEEFDHVRAYLALMAPDYAHLSQKAKQIHFPDNLLKVLAKLDSTVGTAIQACNISPTIRWGSQTTMVTLSCMFSKHRESEDHYALTLVPNDPASEAAMMLFLLPTIHQMSQERKSLANANPSLLWARAALETVIEGLENRTAPARYDPAERFRNVYVDVVSETVSLIDPDSSLIDKIGTCLEICRERASLRWSRWDAALGTLDVPESQRDDLMDVLENVLLSIGVTVPAVSHAAIADQSGLQSTISDRSSVSVPDRTPSRDDVDISVSQPFPDLSNYFAQSRATFRQWSAPTTRQSTIRLAALEKRRGEKLPDLSEHFAQSKKAFTALVNDIDNSNRQPKS
jgi:hypothetical protein